MTGPTHKQYSVTGAFVAAMWIYKMGLTEIEYYLAIPMLLMTAKYGALFPDVDHNWQNVRDKTVPNWIINKVIHLTGGKHRSWQTHSIDIVVIVAMIIYVLPDVLLAKGIITVVNKEVISVLMIGFISGWISHIISDMLTSAGVRLVCFMDFKIKLVPKHLGKLRFNTGNEWEAFNYKVIRGINMVMGVICLLYPAIRSGKFNSLLNQLGII